MDTGEFYDKIAPFYDLIYSDWEASIKRQAGQLSSIIAEYGIKAGSSILDVSCGIGTQTLGLAALGFNLTASDLSAAEVRRAQAEAKKRALAIKLSVCDMREVASHHREQYDVVLSGDNSVPHLLTDSDILKAFRQFYDCTRPGGICVLTVRDYANEKIESGVIKPYAVRERADGRYIIFQVWEVDGGQYITSMYFLRDLKDGTCDSQVSRARYYAIPVAKLMSLLEDAGFSKVKREDGVFFQPVIVGRREG
jgi:2-polyprenyl-3-methyl-5-hydroxy-6-metoxy-1,4-benzoquinol methylase